MNFQAIKEISMYAQNLNYLNSKVPIVFLATVGFSPRRDGRYQVNEYVIISE